MLGNENKPVDTGNNDIVAKQVNSEWSKRKDKSVGLPGDDHAFVVLKWMRNTEDAGKQTRDLVSNGTAVSCSGNTPFTWMLMQRTVKRCKPRGEDGLGSSG